MIGDAELNLTPKWRDPARDAEENTSLGDLPTLPCMR